MVAVHAMGQYMVPPGGAGLVPMGSLKKEANINYLGTRHGIGMHIWDLKHAEDEDLIINYKVRKPASTCFMMLRKI